MQIDIEALRYLAEAKRKALIKAAESRYDYDMAIIAAIGGSAVESLAYLGSATEDSAIEPEAVVTKAYPERWMDVTDWDSAYMKGLKGTIEQIPGANTLFFVDLGMNGVHSSQVSAFAADIKNHPRISAPIARIFLRFKGGGLYRYLPVRASMINDLADATRKLADGKLVVLTVGEYVNRVIKELCEGDEPKAICEKFDPESSTWNLTLSRTQKNNAKGGNGEAVWSKALDFAKLVHIETDDRNAAQTVEEHPTQQESSGTEAEGQVLDIPQQEQPPTEVPTTEQVLEVETPESVPAPNTEQTQSVGGYGQDAVF